MPTATVYYAGFLRNAGGAFMHARAFTDELRRRGWTVSLVTLDSLPRWARYLPPLLQRLVTPFSLPAGIAWRGALTRALFRRFFSRPVDLRVFEEVYVAWNSEVPTVTLLHAVWSDNLQAFTVSPRALATLKEIEARLTNELQHPVVTVSAPYRRYLAEDHFAGVPLRQLDVVELGLETGTTEQGTAEHQKNSLIFVGRLEPRKNLALLLDVFRRLVELDPTYRLTIVGDGPQQQELEAYARAHQLPVSFLGRLAHADVLKELPRHELYVHTSVKESFSFALLEAKLAGLTTCAFEGLEVPTEFIDLRVGNFEPDSWCQVITGRQGTSTPVDASKYTVERMVSRTLALAGV